jgi:hypothetical protein
VSGLRRLPALVVGLVIAGLLLGGCGLRTPSGVRVDQRSVDTAVDDPDIRKLPPGPVPGASPAQIVSGFLEASAADPDHSFALAFLTSGSAWSARDSATIYEPESATPLKVSRKGDTSVVRFSARGLGVISTGGAFVPAERQLNLSFQLRRSGGQWRLVSAPAGVLLTPRDLTRSYRPVRIYTFTSDGSLLVAQPGYVVSDRAGLAGAALHALLTDWGNPTGTVAGGLPQGLTALGSVVVRDGEATVDLGREAFTVPPARRERVVAQIASSLASVPGVFTVRVLVEERPYAGGPVAAEIPEALAPTSSGPVLAVGNAGQLLDVTGGGTRPVRWATSSSGSGAGLLVTPVSAPGGGSLAALRVTSLGDQLLLGDLSGSKELTATLRRVKALATPANGSYLRPQWLDARRLLLAVAGSTPSLQLFNSVDGALHPVSTPGLRALGPLAGFAVSRDGTRAIAVAGAAGARKLYLGRVVSAASTSEGADQLIVDGWTPVPTSLADVSAASWSGDLAVTIVGRPGTITPGESPDLRMEALSLDGVTAPTVLPALPTPVGGGSGEGLTLTAAPNKPVLLGAGGHSWKLQDEQWVALGALRSPAYP